MPLELQIIRAAEFIQVGAQGQFDLAASKEALATLARACRLRGIDLAMLDLRDLRPGPAPRFTPADLAALVSTFPEVGFGLHQRLAILYQSDPHKRVRLFAFLSSMHGWNVKAFDDFEKAFLWLSSRPKAEVAPKRLTVGKQIPIRFGQSTRRPPAGRALSMGGHKKPEK